MPAWAQKQIPIGTVVGYLTVVSRSPMKARNAMWLCRCACGRTVEVRAHLLRSAQTRSCGCQTVALRAAHLLKHGESGTSRSRKRTKASAEYISWERMRDRCLRESDPAYHNYGGRGIRICDRWSGEHGFENFLADLGRRPSSGHTLDRIDVDGHYEPNNCRWADAVQQSNNRRCNIRLTYGGLTMTATQWGRRIGVPAGTIIMRVHRGWTDEEAIRGHRDGRRPYRQFGGRP